MMCEIFFWKNILLNIKSKNGHFQKGQQKDGKSGAKYLQNH